VLSIVLIVLGACGGSPEGDRSGEGQVLSVVTTTGMIADMARQIAGEQAEVQSLMGTGIDPHLYKASESDVRRLSQADLILFNGMHLEGKMGDILVKMARTRPVAAVTEGLDPERLREPPEFLGQYDPHVWFDVSLWAETVVPITRELSALMPEHAETFESRAAELRERLLALDSWVSSQIGQIDEEQRLLVTAHDAFGYFGDRYGMEVVGIQGISTLSEAGLQDVDRVVDLVIGRKVKALFVESSVPRRTIESVQAACADGGHSVEIGGQLFSDAMGAPGTPEGTYEGMVKHNVTTIVEGLR